METEKFKTKTIVLHKDVWAALERLRKQHGSYNKALKAIMLIGSDGKASRIKAVKPAEKGKQ